MMKKYLIGRINPSTCYPPQTELKQHQVYFRLIGKTRKVSVEAFVVVVGLDCELK
jgi:hypothetical protein